MDLEWPSRIVSFSVEYLPRLAFIAGHIFRFFFFLFFFKVTKSWFILFTFFFLQFVTMFSTRWINTVDSPLNLSRFFFFPFSFYWMDRINLEWFLERIDSLTFPRLYSVNFQWFHERSLLLCNHSKRGGLIFLVVRPVRGQLSTGDALMLIYNESLLCHCHNPYKVLSWGYKLGGESKVFFAYRRVFSFWVWAPPPTERW